MTVGRSTAAKAQEEYLASILSSDDFSVADYLNAALVINDDAAAKHSSDAMQQRMTETALQLQYQAANFHEEIGRIGAELSAVLPRCAADVGRVGVGLQGLQMDCKKLSESDVVKKNAAGDDSDAAVSSSLQTLSTLHILQEKLQRTKEILHAQATWDATLDTIHRHMADNKLPEAVHAMASLQEGRLALAGMPGAEKRVEAVENVRGAVQQLLAPTLQNALTVLHTRVAPMQQCVSLYTALGDTDAVIAAYVQFRPSALHRQWFAYDGTQQDLLGFCHGWFDAVHSLMAEERRQASTLFGDDEIVPEVVTKILNECFKSILPSFKSRLKTLYAVNGATGTGSLEMVCKVYEAMLQFLSLVFETIVVSWTDLLEAGKLKPPRAAELYRELGEVFILIASPFAEYQKNLSQLETKYLTTETASLSKDIQHTTSVPDPLNDLESITTRLQELANGVFPIAEQAVARWEVLGAGWNAEGPLRSVDTVVANHVGEVTIAVNKLSAATQLNDNRNHLDESHVVCALQILRVAGSFQRMLRTRLEDQTSGRFGVLVERVASHAARAQKQAGKSFQLPDALSPIEIDSLLTSGVFKDSTSVDSTLDTLQRLSVEKPLYIETNDATRRLIQSCHTVVYDVCSHGPQRALANMNSMSCWSARQPDEDDSTAYGTLPQEYITHVGEHMLSLVQALEPFAQDVEALSLANEIMDGARAVAEQPWMDIVAEEVVGGRNNAKELVQLLMKGTELEEYVLGNPPLEDELEEDDQDAEAKAVTDFCNAWLDVVGLGITGRLLERMLRIPLLTPKGCEHLHADLNYVVNVLSALGVTGHPHPLLGHIAEIVALEKSLAAERVRSMDKSSPIASLLCSFEERILAMRQ